MEANYYDLPLNQSSNLKKWDKNVSLGPIPMTCFTLPASCGSSERDNLDSKKYKKVTIWNIF